MTILYRHDALKGRFPFRLGTTSYIIPDDMEPNVRHLAPLVDDIEIVLFESGDASNIPMEKLVSRLADLASDHSLTYTIHLPLDTPLGHLDEHVRRSSVERCKRIIDRMNPVNPFAYVLHFQGDVMENPPSPDMERWLSQHRRSVEELLTTVPPDELCIETLSYPFGLIEEVVADYRLSICLDIGHIVLCAYDLQQYLDRYLPWTRIVHLHGVKNGKDHLKISHLDPDLIALVIGSLDPAMHQRVLTLEVFGEKELTASLEVMRRYVP